MRTAIAALFVLAGLAGCAGRDGVAPMAGTSLQCTRMLAASYEKVLRDVAPITPKRLGMGGLSGLVSQSPHLGVVERAGAVEMTVDGRLVLSRRLPKDDAVAAAHWAALSEMMMVAAREAVPELGRRDEAELCRTMLDGALAVLDREHDYSDLPPLYRPAAIAKN